MTTPDLYDCVQIPAPRYLLRLAVLRRLFRKYLNGAGKHFLEIGPGMGDVSVYLGKLPCVSGGMVLDRAEKAVSITRERLSGVGNIEVKCADLGELGTASFDYVCSFEVLEHIEDDVGFMRTVYSHMNPGGLWFISVPAYMRKWQMQDLASGHLRRYEVDELDRKLRQAGFDVEQIIDYGFPLTSLMRPFRERYYRPGEVEEESLDERTLRSGTEGRLFRTGQARWMRLMVWPFMVLQRLFAPLHWGDGIVAVARRND